MFILNVKWVIQLLYSNQFLSVNNMLIWAAIGMLFKAVSWTIGFILLTNGSGRLFFCNELFANVYVALLNIFGYKYWGLNGLGYSFLASYFLYFFQIMLVSNYKFMFVLKSDSRIIFLVQLVLSILSLIAYLNLNGTSYFSVYILLVAISFIYSFGLIKNRMDLSIYYQKIVKKNR